MANHANSAANVQNCGKEADMNNQKVTILYERLSVEDDRDTESQSIENQRAILQDYAERNGLTPYIHVCDDGFSGTNWMRPGWQKVLSMVDAGEVACICIKDLSRIRQSFKPGEVTAQQALDLGYELAMRWTRGKHQFVVAAHINTDNPHTHIFFNSVTLNHSKKFQDFKRSAIALRRVSDILCVEHGLSIVENPGLSKGYNRAEYLVDRKPPTGRDKLREMIDNSLCVGNDLGEFLVRLKRVGCEIKIGKQPSIKPPGSKKFFRLDTLGDDYNADAIRERLTGARVVVKRSTSDGDAERKTAAYAASQNRPKLLIDIEEKLRQGYGGGFEQWATIENLKQKAKTLIFLKENGVNTYEKLVKKESTVSAEYAEFSNEIKRIDTRLAEIKTLQIYIGQYSKTRDDWAAYKRSGYDNGLFEANREPLSLHKAAKNYFDEQGFKGKLPSISALKQEYATLLAEKKSLGNVKAARAKMIDWATAKNTTDSILFGSLQTQKSRDRNAR